jgi:hypothetical protein
MQLIVTVDGDGFLTIVNGAAPAATLTVWDYPLLNDAVLWIIH